MMLDRIVHHLLRFGAKKIFLVDRNKSESGAAFDGVVLRDHRIVYVKASSEQTILQNTKMLVDQYNMVDEQLLIISKSFVCCSDYTSGAPDDQFSLHLCLNEGAAGHYFELGPEQRVTQQMEDLPEDQVEAYRSAGTILVPGRLVSQIPSEIGAWDGSFLQWALNAGLLRGQPIGGFFVDLQSMQLDDHLFQFDSWLNRRFRPCLFLDRDGILIEDISYPHRASDAKVCSGAAPLVVWATENGWHPVVVSNQAGVAKGKFSYEDYTIFTGFLKQTFLSKGANIRKWFGCPYHIAGSVPEYAKHSLMRKPHPGMLLKAMEWTPILMTESIMLGDKASDEIEHLPLTSYFVRGRYELPERLSDRTFNDLSEVLEFLKKREKEAKDLSAR